MGQGCKFRCDKWSEGYCHLRRREWCDWQTHLLNNIDADFKTLNRRKEERSWVTYTVYQNQNISFKNTERCSEHKE